MALCSGIYLIRYHMTLKRNQSIYESMQAKIETASQIIILEPEEIKRTEETPATESREALPADENMLRAVDFQTMQSDINGDIYGWIYIPGTNIDYPILQHESSDSYYLNYNLDGTKGYPGCIYTEKLNQKDFSDFNTLIYGHNMKNGSMFHDLHRYKEEAFWRESPYVYVYLPGRALRYEIFAAYAYDDRHILYSFDFNSSEGRREYLEELVKASGAGGLFNEDVTLGEDSRILTLSTCIGGKSNNRFLVQAVLTEEWPEKAAE